MKRLVVFLMVPECFICVWFSWCCDVQTNIHENTYNRYTLGHYPTKFFHFSCFTFHTLLLLEGYFSRTFSIDIHPRACGVRYGMFSVSLQSGQCRADPRFAPSQWETSLQSNAVSHWLDANLGATLQCPTFVTVRLHTKSYHKFHAILGYN